MKIFLSLFSFLLVAQSALANVSCHDLITRPIEGSDDASVLCPQVYGVDQWNGQWNNSNDSSVCGCCGSGSCNGSHRIDLVQDGSIKNQADAQPKCTALCLTQSMCWNGNWTNSHTCHGHGDAMSCYFPAFVCGCDGK
jgi:hypothetical protein